VPKKAKRKRAEKETGEKRTNNHRKTGLNIDLQIQKRAKKNFVLKTGNNEF
jgi:hypothetical protein